MFEYREENLDKNRTVGDLTAQDNVCSFNYRDCKYWFSHRYRQYGLCDYRQTFWGLKVIGIHRGWICSEMTLFLTAEIGGLIIFFSV